MQTTERIILIVSIIINIIVIYIVCKPSKQISNNSKIDSLELVLDSIKVKRDSIREHIDTIIIKIKTNEKYYKETVNTIIRNDVNDDYVFFLNYLKWNRARLDSISDTIAIKGN